MDFNQAYKELEKWDHFFRALRTIREVLEEGQKAVQAAQAARSEEAAARAEVDRITQGIAGTKEKLKTLQKQYAEKAAVLEAQVQAEMDSTMVKLQGQVDAKKAELLQLDNLISDAIQKHETQMAEFAECESTALRTIKDLETKLGAAQKAYNDFKAKLN